MTVPGIAKTVTQAGVTDSGMTCNNVIMNINKSKPPFCRRSSKGVSFAPNVATVMNSDRSNGGGEGGASYRDG